MDVIDLLIQQHREVDALFQAFRRAPDDTSRKELCIQLAEALMLHTTIEERWVYPKAARVVGDDKIEHAEEDHQEMTKLLGEIVRMRDDMNAVKARVDSLERVVKRHIADEEQNILPQVAKNVTEKEIGMSCKDLVREASKIRREEMKDWGEASV
ncbi:hemerythrin domain-containing protein [Myxococcus llanfairpwllgwyngyllgogerychwyrndrobwllllantysiliogogogochensis]|uniref:Hemerythrin domain-containing protein n=1 Tax=Myxococcus llanfairpwllgwyngyllgogerychwyrndrobwllllantysiliogogogochensis TaxID=2590453 RepID=A0A540X5W6_9BACT|nr:hemerythrin domain-containing protein [Myxococcus llanfairpwllgwyngyllgogerychwyrndrobwllllantysiliogogogochensis]NTX05724.1 hemerythrin domain-containing protein [Myxococcus sp. CA040A]TQF16647.1 hemerythrin domain-containing protein [Myxococcus llanfairpwllgwyngyllgogerychwyrndrobwllllantysiliogogogochensis]